MYIYMYMNTYTCMNYMQANMYMDVYACMCHCSSCTYLSVGCLAVGGTSHTAPCRVVSAFARPPPGASRTCSYCISALMHN